MGLKDKLRKKILTIGSWITTGDCAVTEIMAKAGFDWLTVDMEHSAIDISRVQDLIRIISLSGISPLVRVGSNDSNLIKRIMDCGAHGIIVPMVNTREDALMAVSAVKYPPVGARGVGLARAQGYGLEFDRYRNWVNKESIVIVQIEHKEAVDNLEEILSVDGVDGFFVGPFDLSASMGVPGEFSHPKVISAMRRIAGVAKKNPVSPGIHVIPPEHAEVLKKIKEGYKFIAFSLDTLFLGAKCLNEMRRIKNGK
jgi:2-dehydro-3-deoxyglucarate aldolase